MIRIRQNYQSEPQKATEIRVQDRLAGTDVLNTAATLPSGGRIDRYMEDEVHAGFEWRSRAGQIILGPLKQAKVTSAWTQPHHDVCYMQQRVSDGVTIQNTRYYSTNTWDYRGWFSNEVFRYGAATFLQAREFVDSKVPFQFTGILLGVVMAEAKKTMALIPEMVLLGQSLRIFLKANKGVSFLTKAAAWQLSKPAAQSWLAFQYGLMPLLSDIRAFVNIASGEWPEYLRRRNSITRTQSSEGSRTTQDNSYDSRLSWTYTRIDKISTGCYVQLESGETLLNTLGLFQPLSTAWELVPFSCIVDYVVRLSDTFAVLDGLMSGKIKGTYTVKRTSFIVNASYSRKARPMWTDGATRYWGVGDVMSQGTQVITLVDRNPDPIIRATPPLRLPSLGWEQWANVAAVWRQLLR